MNTTDNSIQVSRTNTISSRVKKLFGSKNNNNNATVSINTAAPVVKPASLISTDVHTTDAYHSNSPTNSNSNSSDFSLPNKRLGSSKESSTSSLESASLVSFTPDPMATKDHLAVKSQNPQSNSTTSILSSLKRDNNSIISTTPIATLSPTSCKRFVILEDGRHEHHLKAAKRQEKLTSMLKNIVGSQKVRDEAISAVPDIIMDSRANSSILSSTTSSKTVIDPPTLLSGMVTRLEGNKDMIINSVDSAPTIEGDKYSIKSDMEKNELTVANSNNFSTVIPAKSNCQRFADKYGKCMEVAGRGAFGTVRICHKKSTNKEEGETLFAVKEFIRKNQECIQKYQKRLTAEFCISSSLHHTNIVGTIDLLKDSKGDFLQVMEYCSGGDLFSLIVANGKLEYLEADCFFKQLIKGVAYMHDMGVCHRDLKPENLLLTSDGVLKITDFGNSECFKMAWEKDIHLSGGVCGSSPYIAPEEYVQEEFDPRAIDIWSCGVIYMAMRTGRQLWSLAKKEDLFYAKYLKGRKEKGGYKPIELLKRARCRNVIYSMLDPIPYRRITGKQILNSEWGREIKTCYESRAIKSQK